MPDDSLKRFAPNQPGVTELRARAMFGAHGIYAGEKFSEILDKQIKKA